MSKDQWFEKEAFWKDFYSFIFPDEKMGMAQEEIDNLVKLLDFEGVKVLDLCCGPGRHSLALAKKGYKVTGVDKTEFLLNKAMDAAKKEDLPIEFIQQDMRDFRRENSFQLVLNLYSSFGYFEDPEDDMRVLDNVYHSLQPGGFLVMEMLGKEILSRIFRPSDSTYLDDGTLFLERHRIIDDWERISNQWYLLFADGRYKQYRFSHRLFSGRELRDMLVATGFADVKLYGNNKGDGYDNYAHRLIAVARK